MKNVVLFATSFRGESAPNIDHITLDGRKTLCGRTGWQTEEGWDERLDDPKMPGEVGCRRCAVGYARVRAGKGKDLASMIVRYAKAHALVARHDAWEGEGHHKTDGERDEYQTAHDDIVMLRYSIARAIGVNASELETS